MDDCPQLDYMAIARKLVRGDIGAPPLENVWDRELEAQRVADFLRRELEEE